jgi:hypothetical protein
VIDGAVGAHVEELEHAVGVSGHVDLQGAPAEGDLSVPRPARFLIVVVEVIVGAGVENLHPAVGVRDRGDLLRFPAERHRVRPVTTVARRGLPEVIDVGVAADVEDFEPTGEVLAHGHLLSVGAHERGVHADVASEGRLVVSNLIDEAVVTELQPRNVETPYVSLGAEGWARREARRPACGLGMSEEANVAL